MSGLGGNDIYYVDNVGDVVNEAVGGGVDHILTSVSYALKSGQQIEQLTTWNAGTNALNLTGNAFGQTIYGNAGANVINGGGGADTMSGLGGNDIYYVDNVGDVVNEAVGGGVDHILTSVSYALKSGQQIEQLTTWNAGTNALNLTGNAFGQTIYGNAGANVINGGAGNDTLNGLGAADTFVFNTALNAVTNVDHIIGLVPGSDKIDLENAIFTGLPTTGTLSASAFYIGAAAHDATDRIVYNSATGALLYDADGNQGGAAIQFATLATALALTHNDFVVI